MLPWSLLQAGSRMFSTADAKYTTTKATAHALAEQSSLPRHDESMLQVPLRIVLTSARSMSSCRMLPHVIAIIGKAESRQNPSGSSFVPQAKSTSHSPLSNRWYNLKYLGFGKEETKRRKMTTLHEPTIPEALKADNVQLAGDGSARGGREC